MVNVNLVPIEIKDKITAAKKTASNLSVAMVFVIFFVVVAVLIRVANTTYLDPSLADAKKELAKSYAQLTQYDTYQKEALLINDRLKTAAQIDQKRARWSLIIRALINSVPQNVQFETFTAGSEKAPNFVLTASTDSERNIILFKDKLEKSEYFKNVNFKGSTSAPATATAPSTGSTATITAASGNKVSFSLDFDLEKLFPAPETKVNP